MEKIIVININKSPTADSRTTDVDKVSKKELLNSTKLHIEDVRKGMIWFAKQLLVAANKHDHTKLQHIDMFYKDFKSDFKTQDWYELHKKNERHHLSVEQGIRDDVDLIDVIEFLIDGVMAGLARTGQYKKQKIQSGLLQTAFDNTIDKLIDNISIEE